MSFLPETPRRRSDPEEVAFGTYPNAFFVKAYARAGIGLAVAAGLVMAARGAWWALAVALAVAALAAVYALQTFQRQRRRVEMTEDGLTVDGADPYVLRWSDMTAAELRYFSVRRDGSGGWMELVLRDGAHTLKLDSELSGFQEIAAKALQRAERLGLDVSESTRQNAAILLSPRSSPPRR